MGRMNEPVPPNEAIKKNIDRIVQHPIGGPTFLSLANCLTIFRIFISPIFLFIYLQHDWLGINAMMLPYVLLTLLGISELSDALDGYLARRMNQVTDLGKVLDPMADSIYRISVFLTFTQPPVNVPLLCIFIFLYRDSVISTLRTICALRGFALAARSSGKMKAAIQGVCAVIITGLMIPYSMGIISNQALTSFATLLVVFACMYALYSAGDYLYANRKHIQLVLRPRRKSSVKIALAEADA